MARLEESYRERQREVGCLHLGTRALPHAPQSMACRFVDYRAPPTSPSRFWSCIGEAFALLYADHDVPSTLLATPYSSLSPHSREAQREEERMCFLAIAKPDTPGIIQRTSEGILTARARKDWSPEGEGKREWFVGIE